jgi:hypothetical protein
LPGIAEDERLAVEAAVKNGQLEFPQQSDRSGVLLGGKGSNTGILLRPLGAVLETRPVFEWNAINGATNYSVRVVDSAGRTAADVVGLVNTRWTPSSPLNRGQLYTWQLVAMVNGRELVYPAPPAAEARFIVLDEDVIRQIEQAKQRAGQSHLVMAVLYARVGLVDEARKELEALASANPNAELPKSLIRNLPQSR